MLTVDGRVRDEKEVGFEWYKFNIDYSLGGCAAWKFPVHCVVLWSAFLLENLISNTVSSRPIASPRGEGGSHNCALPS